MRTMLLILAGALLGAAPAADESAAITPARLDAAVDRALGHLAAQTGPDGAVAGKHPVALGGLAILAVYSAGKDREHAPWLRRMLSHLLLAADGDGYLGAHDGSRMYGHAIASLAMAAAIGQTRDAALDARLQAALAQATTLALAAQAQRTGDARGGWRYQWNERDSDLSVTAWQVAALAAAREVGIDVPASAIAAAVGWTAGQVDADGGVGYERPGEDHPALRGAALQVLALSTGEREAGLVRRILGRMRADRPPSTGPWFFYRLRTEAVGLTTAGQDLWRERRAGILGMLLGTQAADGSWPSPPGDNENDIGPAYATAMAVLALTAERRLLPQGLWQPRPAEP